LRVLPHARFAMEAHVFAISSPGLSGWPLPLAVSGTGVLCLLSDFGKTWLVKPAPCGSLPPLPAYTLLCRPPEILFAHGAGSRVLSKRVMEYIPPTVANFSLPADIWALGWLFVYVQTKTLPWTSQAARDPLSLISEMMAVLGKPDGAMAKSLRWSFCDWKAVRSASSSSSSSFCSCRNFVPVIRSMLTYNPAERPTAARLVEVLKHSELS